MKPATAQVLAFLRFRDAAGATPAEARNALACDRLAARVHELRAAGYVIESVRERSPMGATYCRYFIRERPAFAPVTGSQEGLGLA